ncbi:ABATE domain-containing protein (plasmid) [Micrococcaceae bacterium Sec5.7]
MTQQQLVTGQRLALDLVNSTYIQGGTRGRLVDSINSPELLQDWCAQRAEDLAPAGQPGKLDDEDLNHIRGLRAAIRHALDALLNDHQIDPDDAQTVSDNAARAHRLVALSPNLEIRYDWSEFDFGTKAITLIAEDAVSLLAGRAAGVHACQAPGCIMYFIPTTERRRWCSTSCGNRARVARHQRS